MIRFLKPCDECGGTDEVGADGRKSSALNPAQGPCPSCVGGWLPDDETEEAAAAPICAGEDHYDPRVARPCSDHRDVATAALVAAARYQSERVDA